MSITLLNVALVLLIILLAIPVLSVLVVMGLGILSVLMKTIDFINVPEKFKWPALFASFGAGLYIGYLILQYFLQSI